MNRESRVVALLRDYVAIPSLNPMGRDDIPAALCGETRYAEHLEAQLSRAGLDVTLIGAGSRRSVVAQATAREAIDTVLVASHLDTVPVDGMQIDPFEPRIADDRLFGRGSCDTKGGMAAAVAALENVLAEGTLRRNVVLVGEADEELGSLGVRDVLEHLGTRRPDWVLATEPTDLALVTHHKGVAVARLRARGRACHSSDPSAGANAIVALAHAVLALEDLSRQLATRCDPVLGPGTLSIGLAGGGQAPNIVPDSAWLVTDRRLLPGENAATLRTEIEGALRTHAVENVEIESCRVEKGALGTPQGAPAVRACRAALRACGLADDTAAVAFGTDAGVFAERGWPGVVFGPGSITQAHTSREHVPLAQLEAAQRMFAALFRGEAGASP